MLAQRSAAAGAAHKSPPELLAAVKDKLSRAGRSAAGKGTGTLSIREVAAQAMIDAGLITKWMAGTYTGPNGDKIDAAMQQWVSRTASQHADIAAAAAAAATTTAHKSPPELIAAVTAALSTSTGKLSLRDFSSQVHVCESNTRKWLDGTYTGMKGVEYDATMKRWLDLPESQRTKPPTKKRTWTDAESALLAQMPASRAAKKKAQDLHFEMQKRPEYTYGEERSARGTNRKYRSLQAAKKVGATSSD